jgi:hypothetical protein
VRPSERLRRILFALTAALIAAQPMFATANGDGPPTPIAGLTLTLGWLVVFAGWSVWHAIVNPGRSLGGPVAIGLIATAGIATARAAFGASNNWLATLAAWQWVAVPAAFIVVRQLTTVRDDARGLMAVLVATGTAALCVHAAPFLVRLFGFTWQTESPEARFLPDGYLSIASSLAAANRHELRAWCVDVFCLALVVPTAIVFGLAVRHLPVRRVRLLGWPPLILALIGAGAVLGLHQSPTPPSWGPAIQLAAESPGGVGPGLYDRFAVRHTSPAAETVVADRPNTHLGLAAEAGWAAWILFLCTLVLAGRALRSPPPPDAKLLPAYRPRWELQAGGIVGMLGGYVLQIQDWPAVTAPPFLTYAISVGVRVAVWLVVYTPAESSLLTGRADRALTWGLLAVAGVSCVYDILSPGLAESYWAAVAVAINLVAPSAGASWSQKFIPRLLIVLLAVGVLAGFVWTVYAPTIASIVAERRVIRTAPRYASLLELLHRAEGEVGKSAAHGEASRFITRLILQPLIDANQWNRHDPLPAVTRVPWYVALAEHTTEKNPAHQAILTARAAQELDFEGPTAFLAEFQAHLHLADLTTANRFEHLALAQELIDEIVRRDPPLEARLHYYLAAAYLAGKDTQTALREANAARMLDERAPSGRYRLLDAERKQVEIWLAAGQPK